MKLSLTIIAFLFLMAGNAQTQNSWTKKATFAGEKRTRGVAFSIGNFGYVGMGEDTVEMTHNDLWKYDPDLDLWTQVANLPGSTRRNAVGLAVNGKGYVGTGADSSVSSAGSILDDWWEYDADLNSWTQKASYPGGYDYLNNPGFQGIYFATAFEAGGKAYICGGKMGPDFYGTDLWEYDPQLDTWTRKADFPGLDRYQMSSFSIDGKGYVGLGIDHDLYRKDWWEYDPQLDSWTQKSNLPGVERGSASTFVLGQRGFVVFGSDGGYKDELWQYDPYGDSWSIKANFPGGERKNAIAFSIGLKGYAGTGKGPTGKKRNFYEYFPSHPLAVEEYEFSMSLFPNPALEFVNLSFDKDMTSNQMTLIDAAGRIILQEKLIGYSTKLDLQAFTPGAYMILVSNKTGTYKYTAKLQIK